MGGGGNRFYELVTGRKHFYVASMCGSLYVASRS